MPAREKSIYKDGMLFPALSELSLVAALRADVRAEGAAGPRPSRERSGAIFHADAEIDPTAYVLSGYSLHVGLGVDRLRIDLGVFAMTVPEFIHGNEDFESSFAGYGLKAQYFFFAEQAGFFAGVDGALVRSLVRLKGTDLASSDTGWSFGVNAGYRIVFGEGFFVTPWLGLGTMVGTDDVTLAGETFEQNPWLVFPAIHLGYRFR